jgi:predicted small lipoprotein YifL
MRRPILLLLVCLAFATIAGCGNKGPLYYPSAPPHPSHAKKPTPPPAPVDATPTPASNSTTAAPASSSSVQTKPLGGT